MMLRGELQENISMGDFCSWRTGGAAKRLYRPADADDLALFLSGLPENEPLLWVGLGSNLLVRDGGFNGTVIVTKNRLLEMRFMEGGMLRAEAGVTCAKVARICAREGFTGLEFFAGIPGTVGGALAMNAGAFGSETWEHVEAVETIDRQGQIHRRSPDEYRVAYRHVEGKQDEWFLAAEFFLENGDVDEAQEKIRVLLDKRSATQPTNQPTCGSTFRNPDNDFAARLIEEAGLKGFAIGGAVVSEKHANFIVNQGDATAADIEQLIAHVQTTVEELNGIQLVPEVHVVGDPS
ncbi:UDP-N-acetylmuramate dehydrogenase [Solemya elarraichensis gill symbiont]|uniref:UDP-N-acetylenolpyruvoylglucosamine reductase n=1 Tax=Solemya elarraichensis gill symbiont TaxID=1918949 RepID=A0A1T2LDP4_9GAMM|nr:UDP-N-acetylmuramate dehydrogenase [Solemya elarraichensis gill symbiont]OOZ43066.1 UDP-N-acetylenolpyruvoylglucosamine reductase [Solemya elarraichensis gill symbiont]